MGAWPTQISVDVTDSNATHKTPDLIYGLSAGRS